MQYNLKKTIINIDLDGGIGMKNNKEKKIKTKQQKQFDKGQVFIKIMAGILALLMILATSATLIYSLI